MANFSLVIFDFDGTLADSFDWFISSLDQTTEHFGLKRVDPAEIESLRHLSSRDALKHLGVPMLKIPQIAIYMRNIFAEALHEISMFDGAGVQLLGTISGVLENATLWTASLSNATGNARWSGAGVTGAVEARFADMLTEFASQPDGSLVGTLRDDGQGNLVVDGRYSLRVPIISGEATLAARNGDPQVLETLRHIGTPQADGSSKVVVQGRMLRAL